MRGLSLRVINLARRSDRRAQFVEWNARFGLSFEFVEAVDGTQLDRAGLVRDGLVVGDPEAFSAGSLGNMVTKRRLWGEIAAATEPVLFCEDDACLRGDFVEQATRVLRELDVPWDILYFGYNTDAIACVQSRDGLSALLHFDDRAKWRPGYFESFRTLRSLPSTVIRCHQIWGTLCCAVSPEGAQRLLDHCGPLGGEGELRLLGQDRQLKPWGMDGLINLAMQRRQISAFCAYPPIAVSANDAEGSDILNKTAGA